MKLTLVINKLEEFEELIDQILDLADNYDITPVLETSDKEVIRYCEVRGIKTE